MGTIEIEIKYPCGHELKVKYKRLFQGWDGDLEAFKECPMHGKKCVKLGVNE